MRFAFSRMSKYMLRKVSNFPRHSVKKRLTFAVPYLDSWARDVIIPCQCSSE